MNSRVYYKSNVEKKKEKKKKEEKREKKEKEERKIQKIFFFVHIVILDTQIFSSRGVLVARPHELEPKELLGEAVDTNIVGARVVLV